MLLTPVESLPGKFFVTDNFCFRVTDSSCQTFRWYINVSLLFAVYEAPDSYFSSVAD
jgi:hypothetical protein